MRLYVTGGTGLVGSNVIRLARQLKWEIIASQYGPPPEWTVDYSLDPLDLADLDAVRASITGHRPDVVIHAAALLDQVFMLNHRELAWRVMVESTRAVAEACREVGSRLLFISSDWVFDGRAGVVDEDSPPNPINYYGVMKVAAERELGALDGLNYGVARLAGIYGLNYAAPSLLRQDNGLGFDFAVYAIHRLVAGLPATVWTGPNVNEIANPTLASDAAELLLRLARHDGNGIFHCCGSESAHRVDVAYAIAEAFDADPALINTTYTDPAVLDAHRHIGIPFRTRLSTEKTASALGRRALNLREGLLAFRQEWENFHG